MNQYLEALKRLSSIDLDLIEDGETRLNQSDYGIHDNANLEMSGDIKLFEEVFNDDGPIAILKTHLYVNELNDKRYLIVKFSKRVAHVLRELTKEQYLAFKRLLSDEIKIYKEPLGEL